MSEVGRLIDQWADGFEFRPNMSDVARRIGVSRAAVSRWYMGSAPTPENLRALASLTGIPYSRFADAVLSDLGYLAKESDRDAAPMNQAVPASGLPVTGHEWDVAASALHRLGLTAKRIEAEIGSRPPEPDAGGGGDADEGGGRKSRGA